KASCTLFPYTTLFRSNNIAEAEIQGLELSTLLLVTDRLELSLTYSWIDAEYKDWPGFATNVITGAQVPYIDSPYTGTPENQGTIDRKSTRLNSSHVKI